MRETEVAVTFRPSGKTVHVLRGTSLLEAAEVADIVIDQPCGGAGVCGKCRVIVSGQICDPTPVERDALSQPQLQQGFRLACQSSVCGPMTVEVPASSLLHSQQKILARSQTTIQSIGDPPVRKQYVEMSPPERNDDDADLIRLEKVAGGFVIGPELLRSFPQRVRAAGFRGTAVTADGLLIDFEPGNTESESFAVAVDVGTTTLAAVLLDLGTGDERAVVSRLNPQTRFGDDVLARILYSQESPSGLRELHEAIVEAVDEMVGELVELSGTRRERVYEVTFSGNTTMQQLLCRVDPGSLGKVPFVPTMGRGVSLAAEKLALHIHPRGRAYIAPVIGGFVGGDTVSGILATGMADVAGPTLLVDIGTNGEIVLAADGKLTAASTAAGPAFEGARISHGMRGSHGAIEKVIVDGRLRINVIGNAPPVGLCGSGLIDVAAELLRHKIVTAEGRLKAAAELPDNLLPDLAGRLVAHDGRTAFLLAEATETGNGKPIVLTQRDLRELQLAAGAIRAGIRILLRRAGLQPDSLESVLISGGFGNFIRRSNAQRIGLMPSKVQRHRIRYQGNTSLAGARLTAASQQARAIAEDLARRTEHVDLSTDPEFQTAFADAMIFPDSD